MPNKTRRTLTVLKFTDGIWVVQSDIPLHHPGANYASEAKFSLFAVFRGKTSVYDPIKKATKALQEVLYYLDRDDLEVKSHFHKDGVEWHPVLVNMAAYLFDSSLLRDRKRTTGWKVTSLEEHPLSQNIKKAIGL